MNLRRAVLILSLGMVVAMFVLFALPLDLAVPATCTVVNGTGGARVSCGSDASVLLSGSYQARILERSLLASAAGAAVMAVPYLAIAIRGRRRPHRRSTAS